MGRLKTLLQYEAGKYIHLGLIAVLTILAVQSYLSIGLLVIEFVVLIRKSKRLAIFGFVTLLLMLGRYEMVQQETVEPSFPMQGTIIELDMDSFTMESDGKHICYYDEVDQLSIGDQVEVSGHMFEYETLDIMNTFDYKLYLKSQGINSMISVDSIDLIEHQFHLMQIRQTVKEYFINQYDDKTSEYLILFVLGEKMETLFDEMETARDIGVSHLFAISGMHIGLMVGLLVLLLKQFYLDKRFVQIIIIIVLVVYNILLGGNVSALRASLLVVGLFMRERFGIILSRTDILAFIMIAFLLYNPYLIYSLGFQLSFLIACSIILSSFLFRDLTYFKSLIAVSSIAISFGLPLILHANHSFGLISLYANLVIILYVSYIFLPLTLIVAFIPMLDKIYGYAVGIFEMLIDVFDHFNQIIHFQFPSGLHMILYWMFLVLFMMFHKNRKKVIVISISMLFLMLSSMFLSYNSSVFVRFLDVGHGDAIHVHNQGCDLLIDTGSSDSYDNLIQYFRSHNTNRLDYIVITHLHEDHYGELKSLYEAIEINTLYVNQNDERLPIKSRVVTVSDQFQCGDSSFLVLHGNEGDSNENNNSLVLYAVIGGDRYLFTGDIESEVESSLINQYYLDIDILKVPHHGSGTSSTVDFLNATTPIISVISVGESDSYGLPTMSVLDRYRLHSNSTYRTDLDGTITFYYIPIIKLRIEETYMKQKLRQYRLTWV